MFCLLCFHLAFFIVLNRFYERHLLHPLIQFCYLLLNDFFNQTALFFSQCTTKYDSTYDERHLLVHLLIQFCVNFLYNFFNQTALFFSQCTTKSDSTMKGTCYTNSECATRGGTASGNCAAGENCESHVFF